MSYPKLEAALAALAAMKAEADLVTAATADISQIMDRVRGLGVTPDDPAHDRTVTEALSGVLAVLDALGAAARALPQRGMMYLNAVQELQKAGKSQSLSLRGQEAEREESDRSRRAAAFAEQEKRDAELLERRRRGELV